MDITLLTNEYPPHIYGGAGVHVEYLTRELARADGGKHQIQVLCFGDQAVTDDNLRVQGVTPAADLPAQDPRFQKFLSTMQADLQMAGSVRKADVVHGHTWYSHFAGCLLRQLLGARLVLTTHSLEPHRPWKVEQLGRAYHASTWIERTAYQNADGVIAVSSSMRQDVHDLYGVPFERIEVIPNGIDLDQYRPRHDPDVLLRYGIEPGVPFVLFVGRITRQKGIIHLVDAIPHIEGDAQVVLCAGAPDTDEIAHEMKEHVAHARAATERPIIWIDRMLPREDVITLYAHADVFVCPSVYEPFGIINLEAMACETPVVASAVGGIPEILVDGETGVLVPLEPRSQAEVEPADPAAFSRGLADGVNRLMADDDLRRSMGIASRRRVEEHFSWTRIAERTLDFYERVLDGPQG